MRRRLWGDPDTDFKMVRGRTIKTQALTSLGNTLASKLKHLTTQDLSNEIYLTDAEMASPEYNTLQDKPVEDLRTRFTILSSLYRDLKKFLPPLIDFKSDYADYIFKGKYLIL